jgi:hypothetical protein
VCVFAHHHLSHRDAAQSGNVPVRVPQWRAVLHVGSSPNVLHCAEDLHRERMRLSTQELPGGNDAQSQYLSVPVSGR